MTNGSVSVESAALSVGLLSLMGVGIMIGSMMGQSRRPDSHTPPPPYMYQSQQSYEHLAHLQDFDTNGRQSSMDTGARRRHRLRSPMSYTGVAGALAPVPSDLSFDGKITRRTTVQRGLQNMIEQPDLAEWVANGATMEEIYHAKKTTTAEELTPQQVLDELKRGNARFWMGLSNKPEMNAMERRALIIAQTPQVCVLGCSDSRVPVEIVFDQGLGDVFVIRGAGNLADTYSCASIEYAVQHLHVKVLVVMGHEGCGAVKSACLPSDKIQKESENLRNLLFRIKGSMDEQRISTIQSPRARDREAVICNTITQLDALNQNPLIREKVASGELLVVGAFYEITSGIVDFHIITHDGILELL